MEGRLLQLFFFEYWKPKVYNIFNFSIFKCEDLLIKDEIVPKRDVIDWNSIMKLGVEIKNSWSNQQNLFYQYFGLSDELQLLSNEFFSNLKGILIFLRIKLLFMHLNKCQICFSSRIIICLFW